MCENIVIIDICLYTAIIAIYIYSLCFPRYADANLYVSLSALTRNPLQ